METILLECAQNCEHPLGCWGGYLSEDDPKCNDVFLNKIPKMIEEKIGLTKDQLTFSASNQRKVLVYFNKMGSEEIARVQGKELIIY